MASLPILEVLLSNNVYCKFITNTLQEYDFFKLKDTLFWGAIHIDFEN